MNKENPYLVVFSYPFRPFFLLTGSYALAFVFVWLNIILGGWALPLGWSPLFWHSHEMLFGVMGAAMSGFLLTAIVSWTGAPTLSGPALMALVSLWLAGRVAMFAGYWLPGLWVSIIDASYLVVLALYVAKIIISRGNKRNLIIVVVISLLAICNCCMHAGILLNNYRLSRMGETGAMDLIALLMVIIGGRIIPAFSGNWLRNNNLSGDVVKTYRWLDSLAIASMAALIAIELLAGFISSSGATAALGLVACAAAAVHFFRLVNWSGWHCRKEPMLWILHIGYLWIVLALVGKGMAAFGWIPVSAAQHALGVGAMGTLVLGVMTRVTLGHTGRKISLPDFAVSIYLSILIAGGLRVLTALGLLNYRLGLMASGWAWLLAFVLFLFFFTGILTKPRVAN